MAWYLYIFLGLIAFLYSSVGHGGASGYLAFMGLIGLDTLFMKSTALTLNLFVSGIAFLIYYKGGYFRWKLLGPFILTSIPLAFIGAQIMIDPRIYKIILGIFLVLSAFRMFFNQKESRLKMKFSYAIALTTGAMLGLLSGMIGIGGGILLTPFLILSGWATVKEAAAVSAPFIFLNSLAGLTGLWLKGYFLVPEVLNWILIVVLSGLAGSYIGSRILTSRDLRYVLGLVLGVAGVKLFFY